MAMKVAVYGKTGCALCEGAKDKLDRLGVEDTYHDLQSTVEPHEGWREDGPAAVLAGWALIDNHVPLIMINDLPYRYEQFVMVIREKQRAMEVAKSTPRLVVREPRGAAGLRLSPA